MESYIYTEKEERMHVTGDKGLVDTTCLRECQALVGKAFLSEEEKTNFLEKGYMCSRAVINSDAIDEARQYIDRNYSKWKGKPYGQAE